MRGATQIMQIDLKKGTFMYVIICEMFLEFYFFADMKQ